MNRTNRLLAIVLELQGKGNQRAEHVAATFEVTRRIIALACGAKVGGRIR